MYNTDNRRGMHSPPSITGVASEVGSVTGMSCEEQVVKG